MLKKLNGVTFFLFCQNYFILFNFLLCAFKIIMIKGIVYVQCQRWVIKLTLKEKHAVIFLFKQKNLFYVKRIDKHFSILYCIFLINEERVEKNCSTNIDEKILMLCADEVLKYLKLLVNDLRSNSFWYTFYIVTHSHLNLIYSHHKVTYI